MTNPEFRGDPERQEINTFDARGALRSARTELMA